MPPINLYELGFDKVYITNRIKLPLKGILLYWILKQGHSLRLIYQSLDECPY